MRIAITGATGFVGSPMYKPQTHTDNTDQLMKSVSSALVCGSHLNWLYLFVAVLPSVAWSRSRSLAAASAD
jgi:hypothetical protein